MAYLDFSEETIAPAPARAVDHTAAKADYYDEAHRVVRDGVPMRVFHKRSREDSAAIQAIEIARDAGAEMDLEDLPQFSFTPADRSEGGIYRARGAKPVPGKPAKDRGGDYYARRHRYIVGGVPVAMNQKKQPNHSFSHWADLDRPDWEVAKWKERVQAWWDSVEAARDDAEPETVPAAPVEPVERQSEAELAEQPEAVPAAPIEPLAALEAVELAKGHWVLRRGLTWIIAGEDLVWFDSRDDAEREAERIERPVETFTVESRPPCGEVGERVAKNFHSALAAIEAATALYREGRNPSIRHEAFRLIPHGGVSIGKTGEKPRQWRFASPSSDGYKTLATAIAERAGIRYQSHRRGYQASNRAVRQFGLAMDLQREGTA